MGKPVERFRPLLLEEARRLRVQPALRRELVDECLDDIVMQLLKYTTPIPRSLAPYLVKAFRYRRLKRLQAEFVARRGSGTGPCMER